MRTRPQLFPTASPAAPMSANVWRSRARTAHDAKCWFAESAALGRALAMSRMGYAHGGDTAFAIAFQRATGRVGYRNRHHRKRLTRAYLVIGHQYNALTNTIEEIKL